MSRAIREIRLKLTIEPHDVHRLAQYLERFSAGDPRKQTVSSVYFDTPGLALHKGGLSLRICGTGKRPTQIIQRAGAQAVGLFDSGKWECDIRGSQPDLSKARRTALEPLLNGKSREELRPVFETRIRSTIYQFEWAGSRFEATLDQGVIDSGKRRASLAQLDLKLAHGEYSRLFGLTKALGEIAPIHLCIKSEADLGYALVRNDRSALEVAATVHVSRTLSTEAAFRVIGCACLRQLLANEIHMLAGNGEALHQMRVGLRRLRAAMSVFSEIVSDRHSQRIKAELRWIAAALGPARDLDVFLTEVLIPLRQQHGNEPGVIAICRDFEHRRANAYEDAVAAVRSRRFRSLALDALGWIETGPWAESDDELLRLRREQSIANHAAEEIARRRRKLRMRGKTLQQLGGAERHRLRIRAKKARYAIEFFADLFTQERQGKRRRAALSALKDLQGALGSLNDIAAREALTSHIVTSRPSASRKASGVAKAFAAGMIFGAEQAHVAQLLNAAERAHQRFLEVRPFWK